MDWEWAYAGVNTTVPRNAGPECADFLNRRWRYVDTFFVLLLTWQLFKWGWARIRLPMAAGYVRRDRGGRRALLVLMSVVWGMEIGYKFSSRTVIYLLNPCHVTTAIQIYLLAASPSRAVTAVFRFHLNLLNGPLLAFLFPETDTRLLPLESAIYWIQHGMMFVVPYYLLRLGGVYNVEEFSDLSWSAVSYSINLAYHFVILQGVGIPTQVNLNHMLCPALMDPFDGQLYRVYAVVHQAVLCPSLCKLYCAVSAFFLTKFKPTKVKKTLCCEVFTPSFNGDTQAELRRRLHGHEE
ncbi:unnamed protein product [Acanthoscelides obtectus]|uniref:Transmembrane protein 164 n=1 Tax=Acanthoscelides obtectus TaxID=200917 RepID=A0A9P0P176_ACAOB|nr:unnamed protein product [Acanthoscelides obtectus]CAK1665931.1 Transmembrane protein 164 [Acanthoscelides obtectus]